MDVEATLKMNDMVKNLTKHGIISDSSEAMEMAAKMYNVGKKENVEVKEEKDASEDAAAANDKDSDKVCKEEIKHLIDQRLQYFIDKNNKVVINEFQNIWSRLNEISSEIDAKLSQLKQQSIQSQTHCGNVQEELNQPHDSRCDQGSDPNPRSGSYNEDDVAIDKIFYSGQK